MLSFRFHSAMVVLGAMMAVLALVSMPASYGQAPQAWRAQCQTRPVLLCRAPWSR